MTTATTTPTNRVCVRCEGDGYFPVWNHVKGGVCLRCNGTGIDPVQTKKAVTVDSPITVLGTDGKNWDLNQFAKDVATIAKTMSEERVRNLRDVISGAIDTPEYYSFPVAPNVYAYLLESIDAVIGIRFGANVPNPVLPVVDPEPEVEEVEAETPAVPIGTYTIQHEDGSHFTFRVLESTKGKLKGRFLVELLTGPDNGLDFTAFGFVNANPSRLTVNVWSRYHGGSFVNKAREIETVLGGEGLEEAGIRYAVKSSRCRRCNRTLTVPASIHQGYGPDCINKI